MAKKATTRKSISQSPPAIHAGRSSSLLDTRVVYCGDILEQLAKLPDACVDLIYIDSPLNSNRTVDPIGEVFWGETKAPPARSFEDRHADASACIEYMRPRCLQLARVLKKTGSFYNHCDWHAAYRLERRTRCSPAGGFRINW